MRRLLKRKPGKTRFWFLMPLFFPAVTLYIYMIFHVGEALYVYSDAWERHGIDGNARAYVLLGVSALIGLIGAQRDGTDRHEMIDSVLSGWGFGVSMVIMVFSLFLFQDGRITGLSILISPLVTFFTGVFLHMIGHSEPEPRKNKTFY